ncbi:hypothetical protein H4R18_003653 [Coemansia javaensis]|uniref:Uncharacterized protein n=1 Tax=Coemansia javaensis TaxID=2761396 RepID=A0A9W8LI85_9FUNG|nr:hypothetical protein H4R18_003653 [Coemansia javaensis]
MPTGMKIRFYFHPQLVNKNNRPNPYDVSTGASPAKVDEKVWAGMCAMVLSGFAKFLALNRGDDRLKHLNVSRSATEDIIVDVAPAPGTDVKALKTVADNIAAAVSRQL